MNPQKCQNTDFINAQNEDPMIGNNGYLTRQKCRIHGRPVNIQFLKEKDANDIRKKELMFKYKFMNKMMHHKNLELSLLV